MKINRTDIGIFVGDPSNVRTDHKALQGNKLNKNSNIYAGDLNLADDNITQRRKEGMKRAMKVIGDAYNSDRRIDEDIERRRSSIDELHREMDKNQKEIDQLEARKLELKTTYGIMDDSQEELDLQLLEKRRDAEKDPSIILSGEEKKRLAQIDQEGMTEYQKFSLEMDALKEPFQKIIDDSQKSIINQTKTISAIKLEREKNHIMVDANAAADQILEASSKDIIGILVDEAMDRVDEKQEEQKEAAEKAAEEKKEQEENTDTSNQNKATEDILHLNEYNKDIQKEIQNILDKMKLLSEDMMGAAVDTSI